MRLVDWIWAAATLQTHKARRDDKVFALRFASICRVDVPFPLFGIELCSNNYCLKRTVSLNVENLIDMIKIGSEFLVVGIIG